MNAKALVELRILEERAKKDGGDSAFEMQQLVTKQVLEILDLLEKQGHSGLSIQYIMSCVAKFVKYELLTALSGADPEWAPENDYFINIRYPRVIKEKSGIAYDKDGISFQEVGTKSAYYSKYSKRAISFPYFPETTIITVNQFCGDWEEASEKNVCSHNCSSCPNCANNKK